MSAQELRVDGSPVPEAVATILTSPAALRARAIIRRAIAQQDLAHGDTWAYHRNTDMAQQYERRASEMEG